MEETKKTKNRRPLKDRVLRIFDYLNSLEEGEKVSQTKMMRDIGESPGNWKTVKNTIWLIDLIQSQPRLQQSYIKYGKDVIPQYYLDKVLNGHNPYSKGW